MAKRSQKRKTAPRKGVPIAAAPRANTQRLPSWLDREWLWGLILFVVVILAYQPVWHAGFIWDDDSMVTANPCIVGPFGLKEIWTTSAADICPLTITTFWVEHALWGLQPLPYHLVNVFMQGACAIALWRVLRSLRAPGAWFGAALWALHPVQVESVAWVVELKNTQSGLFYLLTVLFFIKGLRAREKETKSGWNGNDALVLLFAALAILSKSSTIILPAVLGLCAWWMEGRWRWRNLALVGPIFLMSVVACAVSVWTQNLQGAQQVIRSWPERLVTAGDAVWFYLGKLLWPHPLMMVYPIWRIDAGRWSSYLPLLATVILLFVFWMKLQSWSRSSFLAWAYFLVTLAPVLGFVNLTFFRYSFVADHFQYLASMGPLALIGAGLAGYANVLIPERQWLQSVLGAGLLLILGALSWQQALAYGSEDTLWTDELSKNPNCWVGHNDLGNAFAERGQADEAIAHYRKALEINPKYADAYSDLGLALFQKGQVDEAIAQYQKALKINPDYDSAYSNLGNALSQKGQMDEAITQYLKALEINPNFATAHTNLGNAYAQKGQVDAAMAQYLLALKISPNFAEAHNSLGAALLRKGQIDAAIGEFQKALEINPDYSQALYNLGNVLLQKGQPDAAIEEYQKALKINPAYAEVYNNLGAALARKGDLDKALVQFQEAVRLKPDSSDAQKNLARMKALLEQKTPANK